jgi:hypothetical protein
MLNWWLIAPGQFGDETRARLIAYDLLGLNARRFYGMSGPLATGLKYATSSAGKRQGEVGRTIWRSQHPC